MESHSGAGIHTAACGGLHAGTGGHTQKEAAAYGGPMLQQRFPEGLAAHGEDPWWGRGKV